MSSTPLYVSRWYTLGDAVALIKSPKRLDGTPYEEQHESSNAKTDAWSGSTAADAWIWQETGDQAALDRIDAEARKLAVSGGTETGGLDLVRDVAGDFPLVEVFLAGEPECMASFENTAPGRVVEIAVNICASAANSAQALERRGSQIFRAVRALELAGYSVGLFAVASIGAYEGAKIDTTIQVKAPGEYLSPAVAAYWFTSPAALRRSLFRLWEHQEELVRNTFRFVPSGGYGQARDMTPPEGTIYLGNIDAAPQRDWYTYIRGELSKRGIEIS